ncbi:aminoglycoside phosphotransferase family protein [Nonomuraea sp. NPDC049421]|uniref:aminoglycoside phosphotransferase family protein n=1 Tax=Nonomuraea sp. NPDC049421 TaxID=3155275 RepID=UPI0034250525
MRITVPAALTASHLRHADDAGPAWVAALPGLAERFLDEWELRPDGEPSHGIVALVLPVVRADGTRAALKLQPVTEETADEALALRTWAGDGAVRLLASDPETGTLLLERLHARRSLEDVPDVTAALETLTALLGRLSSRPAPPSGLRRLEDVAWRMLDEVDAAVAALPRERDRAWLRRCAGAVAELTPELAGGHRDRLLHWDLHYANVLAAGREPWLVIDPKPLAGDPGFELLPALWNRWDEAVATGDVRKETLRRFDLMTEGLGADRRRAAGWTLGRVLQNCLWLVRGGDRELDDVQLTIAEAVHTRW